MRDVESGQLGGSNTAVAFYIAAMNEGVMLDGGLAGRADKGYLAAGKFCTACVGA